MVTLSAVQPPRDTWEVEIVKQSIADGMVLFEYVVREKGGEPFLLNNHRAQLRTGHQRIKLDPDGKMLHVSGVVVGDVEDFLANDSRAYRWGDKDDAGHWRDARGRTLAPYIFPTAPWAGSKDEELDPQWQREQFTLPLQGQIDAVIERYLAVAYDRGWTGDRRGTVLNLQVGANNDDAAENDSGGAFDAGTAFLSMQSHTITGARWHSGFRFTNVTIASGNTIDVATFQGSIIDDTTDDAALDLYCHDVDNTDDFASTTDVKDRHDNERTAASISLVQDALGSGWYSFPDIKACVQEVTDRGTWSSGNALMVLGRGKNSAFKKAHVKSYDADSALAAKLDITHSAVGAQTLSPSGITSAEAFGSATVSLAVQTITAGAIASAETFGSATLTTTVSFTASGIASLEAFGAATVSTTVTITASGIASTEVFGAASISTIVTISAGGIASLEAFGSATVSTGVITLSPSGIASLEAFGSAVLTTTVSISAGGITSAEAFGSAQLNLAFTASGIASLEAFGAATVTTGIIFSAYGNWRALIDPGDYPVGTEFVFEAIVATSNADFPSYAHLYNITDAVVVADSQVQSVDTTDERVRSSVLSLPAAPKEYRCERGGVAGGATYRCYSANVLPKSG